eukprot:GILI01020823.1.p2 GENE.GILI01020823.1~~GILI01020823.1.p2  ORF type:complete len:179 (+),score=33.10 GILI01020823.1:43-537(+)
MATEETPVPPEDQGVVFPELDPITKVQLEVDKFAQFLFTSVGWIQREAPPCRLPHEKDYSQELSEMGRQTGPEAEENFKKQVAALAKDLAISHKTINRLIDELPGLELSEEEQLEMIRQLEQENLKAGEELEVAVGKAEALLSEVRSTLQCISTSHSSTFFTPS